MSAGKSAREFHPDLRKAFGCFTTGVAIATCVDERDRALVAVTINSFVSVSLEPPIVSFSLAQGARCLPSFLSTSRFAINVLARSQIEVARAFARPSLSRWDCVGHHISASGHVLLDGCIARFLCARHKLDTVGDHMTLHGDVVDYSTDLGMSPLTFFCGRFGSVEREYVQGPRLQDEELPSFSLAWG
jgi:flavin reductase (DIM6/NTAB) family NADH-FMN oxidoreductase RutF